MLTISRSLWRKLTATAFLAVGFVLLYETTILDSRYAARQATIRETTALPSPGARLQFAATAYCKGSTTASGVNVKSGVAAADPGLLPVGSVISVGTGDARYNGVYTVMDTGPAVQGRILDLYMWSCVEAQTFGRRTVQVQVLRLGWSPRATTPGLVDRLFRSRAVRPAQPAPAAIPPAAVPPEAPAAAPADLTPPASPVASAAPPTP